MTKWYIIYTTMTKWYIIYTIINRYPKPDPYPVGMGKYKTLPATSWALICLEVSDGIVAGEHLLYLHLTQLIAIRAPDGGIAKWKDEEREIFFYSLQLYSNERTRDTTGASARRGIGGDHDCRPTCCFAYTVNPWSFICYYQFFFFVWCLPSSLPPSPFLALHQ